MRALDAACEAYNIEVLLVHIAGKRNVIADALSRGAIDEALELLRRLTGVEPVVCTIPAEWTEGPQMKSATNAKTDLAIFFDLALLLPQMIRLIVFDVSTRC